MMADAWQKTDTGEIATNREMHSLAAHADARGVHGLAVHVEVGSEAGGGMRLRYRVAGDAACLTIPPRAGVPTREDGLWRHTCFELFVAGVGEAAYREFNFSPSGQWQAYAFTGYRAGGSLEPAHAPDIVFDARPEGLTLDVRLHCANLPAAKRLKLGLCAVLEHADGSLSFWALRHAPGKPDFHHPDTFALDFDLTMRNGPQT